MVRYPNRHTINKEKVGVPALNGWCHHVEKTPAQPARPEAVGAAPRDASMTGGPTNMTDCMSSLRPIISAMSAMTPTTTISPTTTTTASTEEFITTTLFQD